MLDLTTLVYDLPEDVLKRKWAGDFNGEIELIDAMLARDLPRPLKERLQVERRVAERLPKEYPYDARAALEKARERIPDFEPEELAAAELDRKCEYLYINGAKHYHRTFLDTMLKTDASLARRAGADGAGTPPDLDEAIRIMRDQGGMAVRIGLHATLTIDDARFVPGATARVYLPIPRLCAQQRDIQIEPVDGRCAPERAPARTVLFERASSVNLPFEVRYHYVNEVRWVDPLARTAADGPIYPDAPAPTNEDLSEQWPHIAFTPYLRALSRELAGDARDPIDVAWRFYDYITRNIRYSYMRSYALIDRQAEYCALSGKGDCGIQALLFITLCRIAGIPARWQSGLAVDVRRGGCHDWAQFYVEPYGWLFCDPSYGGGAHRKGNEARRRFYFGNLDPYRMVACSGYGARFDPPEDWDRADPYDNQEGEVCLGGAGLGSDDFNTVQRTTLLKRI